MTIVSSSPRRGALALYDAPRGLQLQKALVLTIVLAPFLATAFAIVQVWARAVSWRDLALMAGLYVPISLGVTAGFHRMFTHRSFRAHPPARAVILMLSSIAADAAAISCPANH